MPEGKEKTCHMPQPVNVVNLTNETLSPACISALNKGLSFVPTTYCHEFNAFVDFQKFFRTLRLKEFFSNTPPTTYTLTESADSSPSTRDAESDTPPTKFRGKSTSKNEMHL